MKIYDDLKGRGLIHQATSPEIERLISEKQMTVYIGFDPTSDSLHLGSLLPLLCLMRLQKAGHKIIAVIGGATGMIGDPSGKSQERKLMDDDSLSYNVAGIKNVMGRFLEFGPNAKLVNNADWFKNYNYIHFLRDIGKHFTVNHMTAKDSVKSRLEDRDHGISYTEFSYMLLQAYDFYYLSQNHGCQLQMGGSDQWGNITAGCDLIRKMTGKEAFGLTFPLVTKADGTKFGKSEEGNVWLSADKTSPFQFYQFLLQTSDADVIRYLNFFTFLDSKQIKDLERQMKEAPEKREAQKALASELTRLVHGEAALKEVQGATQSLFSGSLDTLSESQLTQAFKEAPQTDCKLAVLDGAGFSLVEALSQTGLCPSKGQAKKDIQAGAISINQEKTTDIQTALTRKHLLHGKLVVLKKGKKNVHVLYFK